jgi:hypothetical protein
MHAVQGFSQRRRRADADLASVTAIAGSACDADREPAWIYKPFTFRTAVFDAGRALLRAPRMSCCGNAAPMIERIRDVR